MKSTDLRKNRPCLYETALCLAIAKARQDEFRWERFIDNLSQICDTFRPPNCFQRHCPF